nr:MptD family putative ECF transporter S component [Propionicimonas sp.]
MSTAATATPATTPDRKLTVKDLITVGVFSAFYIVVFYATGMLGFIPVFMVLLALLLPIVGGIPFMLYLTRVRKFGMVTITSILVTLVMFAGGHSWPMLVIGPLCGVLADLVFRAGRYASWKHTLLGYWVFSLWVFGPYLPMLMGLESYLKSIEPMYGAEWTGAVAALMPPWFWLTIPVQAAVGALIGAYLGRATLRKHFERAGIA